MAILHHHIDAIRFDDYSFDRAYHGIGIEFLNRLPGQSESILEGF